MFDVNKRITIEEAEAEGYIVDTSIYPHVAYKGHRFDPDEGCFCYTDIEGSARSILKTLLSKLDDPATDPEATGQDRTISIDETEGQRIRVVAEMLRIEL